jgi:hypothetical protein
MGKINAEAKSTLKDTLGFLWNAVWFIAFTIGAIVMAIRNQDGPLLGRIIGVGAVVFLAVLFAVLTVCGFIEFARQRRKS